MSYLNLASIRLCTESEGPGKRLAIWVQGCEKRCTGCCNPEMQEIRKNIIVDTRDLIELISRTIKKEEIEGISIIGGEPVLQAEGLADIAEWCQINKISVMLFSGYVYGELLEIDNPHVKRLLNNVDLLVDGLFIEKEYDTERDWVGSKNQKVWFLTERYFPGIEYEKRSHSVEILISDKNILFNGWPYI